MNKHSIVFAVLALLLASGLAFGQTPPTPTNLVAQMDPPGLGTHQSVKLMWQIAAGHWSFRVYRSANDTSHFQVRGTTMMLEFHDFEVTPGTTYYYYVKTLGTTVGQESPRSNIASITVPIPVPPPRGTIAGTVVDDSTLAPIRGVLIRFYRRTATLTWHSPAVITDSLGRYSALLDTGTYIVKADPAMHTPTGVLYRPEWYNNVPEPSQATPIVVAEGSLFVANFGLARLVPPSYAYINGTVTDTVGTPLRNATVAIMRTMQEMAFLAATTGTTPGLGEEIAELPVVGHTLGTMWTGRTDSLGNYHARLVSGRSYIALGVKEGYLPEYFNNKTNPVEADIIFLARDTSGINFSLAVRPIPQNSISGIVRDSLGTRVRSRVVITPVARNIVPFPPERYVHTDSLGVFTINNVEGGKYFVRAIPFSGFAPAYYKAGAYGIAHREDADTVNIIGNVTGINVGVVRITSPGLVHINGTVRSISGAHLVGAVLVARSSSGEVVGCGFSDASGSYAIDAIPSGTITIDVDRYGYSRAQRTINISSTTFTVNSIDYTLSPSSPTSVGSGSTSIPSEFSLNQNYPNPFNPSTTIRFNIPVNSIVSLTVYNLLGQEIATILKGEIAAGTRDVVWNGNDNTGLTVASGLYFYRLKAIPVSGGQEFTQMRKMILLK